LDHPLRCECAPAKSVRRLVPAHGGDSNEQCDRDSEDPEPNLPPPLLFTAEQRHVFVIEPEERSDELDRLVAVGDRPRRDQEGERPKSAEVDTSTFG
jgi:hypothetical protein